MKIEDLQDRHAEALGGGEAQFPGLQEDVGPVDPVLRLVGQPEEAAHKPGLGLVAFDGLEHIGVIIHFKVGAGYPEARREALEGFPVGVPFDHGDLHAVQVRDGGGVHVTAGVEDPPVGYDGLAGEVEELFPLLGPGHGRHDVQLAALEPFKPFGKGSFHPFHRPTVLSGHRVEDIGEEALHDTVVVPEDQGRVLVETHLDVVKRLGGG